MARSRYGFFSLAGLMAVVALSFGTASIFDDLRFDRGASAEMTYRLTAVPIYLNVFDVTLPESPALAEREAIPTIDPTSRLFASLDQPGQSWRTSADVYKHIDPGRRIFA